MPCGVNKTEQKGVLMNEKKISMIEKELKRKCPSLFEYFVTIKNFCIQFWDKPICRHYTTHDIRHSLKLLSYIYDLKKYCNPPLNPDELYILLASVYLHDISMQFPHYLINRDIAEITYDDCEKIRKEHRKIIGKVIDCDLFNYFRENTRFRHFPYHSFMAKICINHNEGNIGTDFWERSKVLGGENVRIRLLIALLQCADALDISPDRINEDLSAKQLPFKSQKYWWKNYYTREVLIDDRCMRITLHYVIPDNFVEHMDVFIDFAEFNFKRFHGDALDVLWDHGIRLKVGRYEPWILIDDRRKLMPHQVLQDIKQFLAREEQMEGKTAKKIVEKIVFQQSIDRILEVIKFKQKVTFDNLSEALPEISTERLEKLCTILVTDGNIKFQNDSDEAGYYLMVAPKNNGGRATLSY